MEKRGHSLSPLHNRSLDMLRLLRAGPCTHEELADQLHIGRRSVQQCLQSLRLNGFLIQCRTRGRRRFFWTTAEVSYLPPVFSTEEKIGVTGLLTHANPHVQSAVYKMIQLTIH